MSSREVSDSGSLSRGNSFRLGIEQLLVILGVLLLASLSVAQAQTRDDRGVRNKFNEATVAELQADMNSGTLTSEQLVHFYLDRIAALDRGVNAIMQLNPDALQIARMDDRMRGHVSLAQFPLLGIPVLLKDNLDTGDRMQTTAGSFVLFGTPATRDSTVAAQLRAAGAVILGKTTLSEWANFRSSFSTSGWS